MARSAVTGTIRLVVVTIWGFHEAVTDILRGSNLITLPKKNRLLNNVINGFIGDMDNDSTSSLGDFYEQRYDLAI